MDSTRYVGKGSEKRIAHELMGKVVRFHKTWYRAYGYSDAGLDVERKWQTSNASGVGWVVGVRHLQNGSVERVNAYGFSGEDAYNYLRVDSTVPALLVVEWPTKNARKVPFENAELVYEMPDSGRKWPNDEFHAQLRKEYASYLEDAPRDEKGRFV